MLTRLSCGGVISACGEGFSYNVDAPSPVIIACYANRMISLDFGNLCFEIPYSSTDVGAKVIQLRELSMMKEESCIDVIGDRTMLQYVDGSYHLSSLGISIIFECNPSIFRLMANAVAKREDALFGELDIMAYS